MLLHIHVEVLEYQVEFVLSVNDVEETYDSFVVQFLQKGYFSESCAWNTLVAVFDFDFLKGDSL